MGEVLRQGEGQRGEKEEEGPASVQVVWSAAGVVKEWLRLEQRRTGAQKDSERKAEPERCSGGAEKKKEEWAGEQKKGCRWLGWVVG